MSMREEIAKSIYERRNGHGAKPWARQPQAHRDPYLSDAEAVLDALMEPTEGMMSSAIQTDEVDSIDWVEALRGTGITSAQTVVVASYKAMIRAAKEGK